MRSVSVDRSAYKNHTFSSSVQAYSILINFLAPSLQASSLVMPFSIIGGSGSWQPAVCQTLRAMHAHTFFGVLVPAFSLFLFCCLTCSANAPMAPFNCIYLQVSAFSPRDIIQSQHSHTFVVSGVGVLFGLRCRVRYFCAEPFAEVGALVGLFFGISFSGIGAFVDLEGIFGACAISGA